MKKVRKSRISDNSVVLENYDKETINTMLERKAKQVGDVVLVNGKPAIIKKRVMDIPPLLNGNIKKKRVRIKSKARKQYEGRRTPRRRRLRAKNPMQKKI